MSLLFHKYDEEGILGILEHTAVSIEETFDNADKRYRLRKAERELIEELRHRLHDIRTVVHKHEVPVRELADFAEHVGLAMADRNFKKALHLCDQADQRWTKEEEEKERVLKRLARRLKGLRPSYDPA